MINYETQELSYTEILNRRDFDENKIKLFFVIILDLRLIWNLKFENWKLPQNTKKFRIMNSIHLNIL